MTGDGIALGRWITPGRRLWLRYAADGVLIAAAAVDAFGSSGAMSTAEIVVSTVAVAALLARRRWPVAVFVLTLPGLFFAETGLAAVVALYSVALSAGSVRVRRWWLVAVGVAVVFVGFQPITGITSPGRVRLIDIVYGVVFAVGPAALGSLVAARRTLRQQMLQLRQGRDREQRHAVREAVLAERSALAREMHDVVSNHVSLIAVQAGALQVATPDADVRETARTIRQLSTTTLDELRTMLGVLRSDAVDVSSATAIDRPVSESELRELVDQSGLDVVVRIDLAEALPPATGRALYRGLQEAITNIRKHAPRQRATIEVVSDARSAVLIARNTMTGESLGSDTVSDGDASSLPGSNLGLLGLAERASLLGGRCTSGRLPDGSFQLRLELPR